MEFKDALYKFAQQVSTKKLSCATEEATKHSLILPIIQLLGYDIFDPTEVVPEVDCDLKHTGDRVDYIIERDGTHQILIECKHWRQNLDRHITQLGAYFAASAARIGILTNGIEYRFYTDLEKTNLMDDTPFLVVSIESLSDEDIAWLDLFRKRCFNTNIISSRALQNRRKAKLRQVIADEFSSPSPALVKHFAKQVYGNTPGPKALEQFRPLLIKAIGQYAGNSENQPNTTDFTPQGDHDELLVTVQSILGDIVSSNRVVWKENQQYNTIRLDGSEWSPICRLKYTQWAKWISITHWDEETERMSQGEKHPMESPQDIHKYANELRTIVQQMLTWHSHKERTHQ